MNDSLDAYLGMDRAGRLWLNPDRRFFFQYDPDWVARG